jgi:hypothetical protein
VTPEQIPALCPRHLRVAAVMLAQRKTWTRHWYSRLVLEIAGESEMDGHCYLFVFRGQADHAFGVSHSGNVALTACGPGRLHSAT